MKQYFLPAHRIQIYRAQIRSHMVYCSQLWAVASKCQLLLLDRIQRRAVQIVDNKVISYRLDSFEPRRDGGSLCTFYRLYFRECSEKLFGLNPTAEFYYRTTRKNSVFHPYYLDVWKSNVQLILLALFAYFWYCRCPWVVVITNHQLNFMLVCRRAASIKKSKTVRDIIWFPKEYTWWLSLFNR